MEPFDGLDDRPSATGATPDGVEPVGMTLALVLNRFDEIPDFVRLPRH